MHPPLFGADAVQHRTDGVGDATPKQQQEAGPGQCVQCLFPEGNHRPAHADVADHGKDLVLFQIDGGQGRCDGHQHPFKNEQSPGQRRVVGPQGRQHHGGVGAGNEKIDGAVVDDLHHQLAHAGPQAVIDAGHGVHGNKRKAVKGAGHHAPDVAVQRCPDQAQHRGQDPQSAANNVGDHVHDLFAPGVVGQFPVG